MILIDGTQFLGAEVFSLRESPVDAVFGSTYKWLLAGHGTGYAMLKPSLLSHLNISQEKLAATYDRGQLSVKSVGSLAFSLKQIIAADFPKLIQYKKQLSHKDVWGIKKTGDFYLKKLPKDLCILLSTIFKLMSLFIVVYLRKMCAALKEVKE